MQRGLLEIDDLFGLVGDDPRRLDRPADPVAVCIDTGAARRIAAIDVNPFDAFVEIGFGRRKAAAIWKRDSQSPQKPFAEPILEFDAVGDIFDALKIDQGDIADQFDPARALVIDRPVGRRAKALEADANAALRHHSIVA